MHLVELDSVEVLVIVDNEIDSMSPYRQAHTVMTVSGQMKDIALRSKLNDRSRGSARSEFRMDNICCGAHGLSLMITGTVGDTQHTMMFDTGPEESAWERNATRLGADIGKIELVHLSHWHRDHSGGMLRAVKMINAAKSHEQAPVIADLHPSRPAYRGSLIDSEPVSLEADPSFVEIEQAGGIVSKNSEPHTVLDDMFLVSGEIPRVTDYELGLRNGVRFIEGTEQWEKDELILDERFAMCHVKNKGLILFTGCSHGGVINACKHAVSLTGGQVPLFAVVGGFHLVDGDDHKVKSTVEDFKQLDPTVLLPGHCSGWRVKFEIEKELPGRLAPCTVGTNFAF